MIWYSLFKKQIGKISAMKFSEVVLPSNRKFGFFFTFVFAVAAAYFYVKVSLTWFYLLAAVATMFLVVTLAKADALLPLNKLWMRFGLLLSMIVSPIVFGVIFFGLFTPIALVMRISGRDELRLRSKPSNTLWIPRSHAIQAESFKNQF